MFHKDGWPGVPVGKARTQESGHRWCGGSRTTGSCLCDTMIPILVPSCTQRAHTNTLLSWTLRLLTFIGAAEWDYWLLQEQKRDNETQKPQDYWLDKKITEQNGVFGCICWAKHQTLELTMSTKHTPCRRATRRRWALVDFFSARIEKEMNWQTLQTTRYISNTKIFQLPLFLSDSSL